MEDRIFGLLKSSFEARFCSPSERILAAHKLIPKGLVMTSSFGKESAIMLDLTTRLFPNIPVLYIDHGCWRDPDSQREFVDKCVERFGLNLVTFRPRQSLNYSNVESIYSSVLDAYEISQKLRTLGQLAKVEPLDRALECLNVQGWMSGVSRDDPQGRSKFEFVSKHNGRYKMHPLLDVPLTVREGYIKSSKLPVNENYHDPFKGIDQNRACQLHPEERGEKDGSSI